MKLSELDADSKINVTVSRGNTSATLTTDFAFVSGSGICVTPFRHGASMVSFDALDLTIDLVATKEGEVPYLWKNVRISKVSQDSKSYHLINSNTEGVRHNRRNAFRVFFGDRGTVISGEEHKQNSVIVKDISTTGVAFLTEFGSDAKFEVGNVVNIKFEDESQNVKFDLIAKVVRVIEIEETHQVLYGCLLTHHYPQIGRYVAAKQMKNRPNSSKR